MIELDPIRAKELEIAQGSFSTAMNMEGLSPFIKFPKKVQGMRILDIGSGASPAIAELNQKGARAVGFDFRYHNMLELVHSVRAHVTDPSSSDLGATQMIMDASYIIERSSPPPAGVDPSVWKRQVDAKYLAANIGQIQYLQGQEDNFNSFIEHFFRRDMNLVAGVAGSLPFKDESFDFAYSSQTVSQFLMREDPDVFLGAVKEGMRVLAPYGELQMFPWYDDKTTTDPKRIRSSKAVTDYLKANKFKYDISDIKGSIRSRITIFNND